MSARGPVHKVRLGGRPWNYTCALCETSFLGVAADEEGAKAFGRNHTVAHAEQQERRAAKRRATK